MSVRSALFACLVTTAAVGCQQRDETPARTLEPAKPIESSRSVEPYTPEQTGTGTAAPNGGGAFGGVLGRQGEPSAPGTARARTPGQRMPTRSSTTARNPHLPNPNTNATDPTPNQNDPQDPSDINSNTTTGESGAAPEPRSDELSTSPEPGTSDTSTQSTRPVPDSQDQGIGGGDTYDRNR